MIIIWLLASFFPTILNDGFSLKFKWQQVSSDLQDSSKYNSWF